jgi:hypothetical protein
MNARRSFYLNCKQNDFAELDQERSRIAIPYTIPANENLPTRIRLSARCRALFRRLIAIHALSWPNEGS